MSDELPPFRKQFLEQTCGDCLFYDPILMRAEGICRRYPPQAVDEDQHGLWPIVGVDRVACGEWDTKAKVTDA